MQFATTEKETETKLKFLVQLSDKAGQSNKKIGKIIP